MLKYTETDEPSLSNKIEGTGGKINLSDAVEAVQKQPTYVAIYIVFFAIIGALYLFNLIFVNPVSVFCQVGTCIKQKTAVRKRSKDLKNKRI